MSLNSRKTRSAFSWTLIGGLCLATGLVQGSRARAKYLSDRADHSSQLAGMILRQDADHPLSQIGPRLARMKQADASIVRLSVLQRDAKSGQTHVIADAQGMAAPGSHGGLLYAPAAPEDFEDMVRTAEPVASAPVENPDGAKVIAAYAPIADPGAGSTDYVLAAEFDSSDWSAAGWDTGLRWAGYVALVLGLPYGWRRASQRQEEQRSALRNLSEAMEQSRSAVMIVNLESRIEYVNAGLCAQIGYSRRELIGKPWREFQQKETSPEMLAEMVATVRAGSSWHGEWYLRRKSGEPYTVRGDISPVKRSDGRLVAFVAVFEDMTDIKRGEVALRAALDRAEAGDRAKSQFLATMSHEVRTPLNGIVGFTSLLTEMPLAPEAREYVGTIQTSAEALIQLTGDILDFAKIESGSMKLESAPTNPRAVVEDVLDLFAVAAAAKAVELLHWIDDDVPAAIMVDDARIRQVLANLVGNAVKFTERGVVEVTVTLAPGEPGRLAVRVRDTGIGIPLEHQAGLFKPFRQVDETSTRKYGGSGLGLAISRNLAQLMGGDIELASTPGEGSRFTLTIPAVAAPDLVRTVPSLKGLRLALVCPPGPFRSEFERLTRRWNASLASVSTVAELSQVPADVACVVLNEASAAQLADAPAGTVPWPAARACALVPLGLESDRRKALAKHFGQLINKPLRHDAVAGLLAAGNAEAAKAAAPAAPRKFGLNVLVVEDNLVNQRLVQRLLVNLGCQSTLAGNGRIGLEALRAAPAPYDLVLMDLHMPELDGLGAIERIRKGEAGDVAQRVWITVLTADARAEQKERVYEAGANDYLVKPVALNDLATSLRRFADTR